MKTKFLLLLGVSGAGKSSIINSLREIDYRYKYISPFVTRELRNGEKDKVFVSEATLDKMVAEGSILVVNSLYNVRYATPKKPILSAFKTGFFPLLDWPIDKLKVMTDTFGDDIFTVYLYPSDVATLKSRLQDGRDPQNLRLKAGQDELNSFRLGKYNQKIDFSIESSGSPEQLAQIIHKKYLSSLDN